VSVRENGTWPTLGFGQSNTSYRHFKLLFQPVGDSGSSGDFFWFVWKSFDFRDGRGKYAVKDVWTAREPDETYNHYGRKPSVRMKVEFRKSIRNQIRHTHDVRQLYFFGSKHYSIIVSDERFVLRRSNQPIRIVSFKLKTDRVE